MSYIINTGLNLMNTAYNGANGTVLSGDAVKGGYFVTDRIAEEYDDKGNIIYTPPTWTRHVGTVCYNEQDKKFYQFNGEDWGPTELDVLGKTIEDEIKRAREEEQKLLHSLGETKDDLATEVARATEKEEALELAIARNTGLISSEEESRKEADMALSTSLNTEIAARQSQVAELQSAINEEVGRATSKEAELSQDLSRTNTQVVNLEQRIVLETVARTDAINEVNSNINTKISAEALSRIEADELLQLQIVEEAANRQEESDSLRNSLSDEIYTARAAESDLERKISNEERERINEDIRIVAALNNEISKLDILIGSDNEKSVRKIANEELAAQLLSGEAEADFKTLQELSAWLENHPEDVTAINEAIQQLQKDLLKEADDRAAADNTEARIRAAQDTALNEALTQEIKLREDQVVGLNFSLKEEVNRAIQADANMNQRIAKNTEEIEKHVHEAEYTPSGTISQPTFTGEEFTSTGKYTPAGKVDVTLNVTEGTASKKTKDGTSPTFVTKYNSSLKKLSFMFNQGSLPEFEDVTVITSVEIDDASFTGIQDTINVIGTPTGAVSQPTFTGTDVTITTKSIKEVTTNE